MSLRMECPNCTRSISVWKLRNERKCPSCGALLANKVTPQGYVILVIILAIAGAADYYANVKLIIPLCNHSDGCFYGWNVATAILYPLSGYVSAALGAFHYSVVPDP